MISALVFLLLVHVNIGFSQSQPDSYCVWDKYSKDGRDMPLAITPVPTSGHDDYVKIPYGSDVVFVCATSGFKAEIFAKSLQGQCSQENMIELQNGTRLPYKNFECNKIFLTDRSIPNKPGCPERAESLEIGSVVPEFGMAFIHGDVCYSTEEERTLFIHYNSATDNVVKSNNFRSESQMQQRKNTSFIDKILERATRKLENKLGDIKLETAYFVSKGNMVAGNQKSIGETPYWNHFISNSNLAPKSLWTIIRQISTIRDIQVDVWIGTSGVLKMKDAIGNKFDFYLQDNKFPVPKYIWGIVNNANGDIKSQNAYIAVNDQWNQHLESRDEIEAAHREIQEKCPKEQSFFHDVMQSFRNLFQNSAENSKLDEFKRMTDMFYTCSVRDLTKIIPEISQYLQI
ncbi:hypothetical protein DMENIID0001_141870 [Sergentomyia squamirostris]